jgi:hypothetical protein
MSDIHNYYDDDDNVTIAPTAATRGPARKSTLSSHLPIRFAPAVLAAARRLAVVDGVSISTWVRQLVEREVQRRTPTTTHPSPAPRVDVVGTTDYATSNTGGLVGALT